MRELRGLAPQGGPPRIFENLGNIGGTQFVSLILVDGIDGGTPDYFCPTGDGPECGLGYVNT